MDQELLQVYLALKKAERSSLTQRVKIQNIKYNDAPTRYYFSKIAARKHQCLIGKIVDRHGIEKEGMQGVNQAFIEYYKWLLGQQVQIDSSQMGALEGPRTHETSWDELCRDVDDREIKLALFFIASNKSPGQDGFSAQFFKTSWDTIRHEFCNVVKGFFKTWDMSKQANTTLLALNPKKPVVSTFMDYWTIA
ncbi:uncharacterized protein LOC141630176 [Silene latifolia]|uniref:uncharacterized protein LOC141630176 n=1 Tax=Silene latifolia TaxID=37657 RepID=UPI003D771D21